jgi:hypothetical protein
VIHTRVNLDRAVAVHGRKPGAYHVGHYFEREPMLPQERVGGAVLACGK